MADTVGQRERGGLDLPASGIAAGTVTVLAGTPPKAHHLLACAPAKLVKESTRSTIARARRACNSDAVTPPLGRE